MVARRLYEARIGFFFFHFFLRHSWIGSNGAEGIWRRLLDLPPSPSALPFYVYWYDTYIPHIYVTNTEMPNRQKNKHARDNDHNIGRYVNDHKFGWSRFIKYGINMKKTSTQTPTLIMWHNNWWGSTQNRKQIVDNERSLEWPRNYMSRKGKGKCADVHILLRRPVWATTDNFAT